MGEAGLFDEDPQRREKRAAFLGGSERILDYLPESRAGQDVAHDPGNAVSDDYLRCWLTQIDPNDQVLVLAVGSPWSQHRTLPSIVGSEVDSDEVEGRIASEGG